ncbi:hypothetical protein FRC11_013709, partial [Ceratobasidium sp. 423]
AKDATAPTADHPNQANEYSIIASSAPRPEVEARDTQNEIKTDTLAGPSSDEGTVKRPEGGGQRKQRDSIDPNGTTDKPSASSNPVERSGQTAINPADTGVVPSAEVTSQELAWDDDSDDDLYKDFRDRVKKPVAPGGTKTPIQLPMTRLPSSSSSEPHLTTIIERGNLPPTQIPLPASQPPSRTSTGKTGVVPLPSTGSRRGHSIDATSKRLSATQPSSGNALGLEVEVVKPGSSKTQRSSQPAEISFASPQGSSTPHSKSHLLASHVADDSRAIVGVVTPSGGYVHQQSQDYAATTLTKAGAVTLRPKPKVPPISTTSADKPSGPTSAGSPVGSSQFHRTLASQHREGGRKSATTSVSPASAPGQSLSGHADSAVAGSLLGFGEGVFGRSGKDSPGSSA